MDNILPRIHGIDHRCRSLAALEGETEAITFLVGTQSMKNDNTVHLFELDEEYGELNDIAYPHPVGEVWHISSSSHQRELIATCHSHVEAATNLVSGANLWRLGTDSENPELEDLGALDGHDTSVRMTEFGPEGCEGQLCSLGDTCVIRWDINEGLKERDRIQLPKRSSPAAIRWNPHSNGNQIGVATEQNIRLFDTRTLSAGAVIENAHTQTVRDLDFNPNRQYFLVTCGDDCSTKIWDTRQPTSPLLSFENHSHWVWKVRYNLRDQLILSSGSDSKVVLLHVPSLASEPITLGDEGSEDEKEVLKEGIVEEYEKHEDSVYSCAWSIADPWLFASLSHDGRLVLNKISRDIKYSIIL